MQQVSVPAAGIRLGRLPENELVLPHPLVSRAHAEIRPGEGGQVVLTDLGSTHGTELAGERLLPNQPYVLTPGVAFRIGPFEIRYEAGSLPVDVAASAARAAHGKQTDEPFVETPDTEPDPTPLHLLAANSGDGYSPELPDVIHHFRRIDPAAGPQSKYLQDLPIVFHDNEFLGRFLLIFETLWEPLEHRQDAIHMYFDPRTSPNSFLPWLASWFDLVVSEHWPEARRRRLVAEAAVLYRWRGTPYGLTRMIELCTGVTPVIQEVPSRPHVFSVRLKAPPHLEIDRTFVEEIIRTHKPAHAGYILEMDA